MSLPKFTASISPPSMLNNVSYETAQTATPIECNSSKV